MVVVIGEIYYSVFIVKNIKDFDEGMGIIVTILEEKKDYKAGIVVNLYVIKIKVAIVKDNEKGNIEEFIK